MIIYYGSNSFRQRKIKAAEIVKEYIKYYECKFGITVIRAQARKNTAVHIYIDLNVTSERLKDLITIYIGFSIPCCRDLSILNHVNSGFKSSSCGQ